MDLDLCTMFFLALKTYTLFPLSDFFPFVYPLNVDIPQDSDSETYLTPHLPLNIEDIFRLRTYTSFSSSHLSAELHF